MNNRIGFFIITILFAFLAGTFGGSLAPYLNAQFERVADNSDIPAIQKAAEEAVQQTTIVEESEATNVVEEAKPAVVSIVITKELQTGSQVSPFTGDPFFDQFFGTPQGSVDGETEEVEVGEGSGFVVTEDGLIVTNRHVVEDTDASYTVVFDNGDTYDAKVLDRDNLNDLAIMKIDASGLATLPLGDSDALKEGQTVIAIGNTLGEYTNTVTKGVVSGLARDLGGEYSGLIQTDAAISQGNSGGPLLNLQGEVIGINTAVDRAGDNLGFAIPVHEAQVAVESVKENGEIVRPALGVRYIPITPEVAEANNLLRDYGAYINGGQGSPGVVPGSAAEEAGLEEGDTILQVDGTPIDEENTLPELLRNYQVGEEVTLLVLKEGEETQVVVILAPLPDENIEPKENG